MGKRFSKASNDNIEGLADYSNNTTNNINDNNNLDISNIAEIDDSNLESMPNVARDSEIILHSEYTHTKNNKPWTVNDFELIKVLGKGAYGKVMLARRKEDSKQTLYAMKTMRKALLAKQDQILHASTERYILQNLRNPFLTHLMYAFQTPDKLYMVLEYLPGGELFFWLKKEKRFSEDRVRLYAAELTLALETLHEADICYRDIKPENILLDAAGHLRVTDFGLAKGNITGSGAEGGTKTYCGTPEYLAPEMLENKGHGKAVDWWGLGILTYEMLVGIPPFFDSNVQRMYHKILHDTLRFPKAENRKVGENAKDFLRRLLDRKVSERLGSGPKGAKELKESPFFDTLDWDLVYNKRYKCEFIPPVMRHEGDVRNFDVEFTKEKAVDSVVTSTMSATLEEKTRFEGFSYQGSQDNLDSLGGVASDTMPYNQGVMASR